MKVLLNYFRRSGKWYSEGEYETQKTGLWEIWEEVQAFRQTGDLPGLVHSDDGRLEYIVSIDVPEHPHRHPHLLV